MVLFKSARALCSSTLSSKSIRAAGWCRRPRLCLISLLFLGLWACDDEDSLELRVTAQPAEGNAPFSVRFTADHNSPVESDLRYEWDFGDGQESDETNPRHRFETAGEYTITVKVKDESQGLDGVRGGMSLPTSPLTWSYLTLNWYLAHLVLRMETKLT